MNSTICTNNNLPPEPEARTRKDLPLSVVWGCHCCEGVIHASSVRLMPAALGILGRPKVLGTVRGACWMLQAQECFFLCLISASGLALQLQCSLSQAPSYCGCTTETLIVHAPIKTRDA